MVNWVGESKEREREGDSYRLYYVSTRVSIGGVIFHMIFLEIL